MEIYTVAFFGHRYIDNFSRAENGVESIVRDLLNSHEYVDFLMEEMAISIRLFHRPLSG